MGDDDSNTGAVIAGAAALGASAINAGMQERTNKWQLKLAQYAYDQERQMIREQNEYNSPLNQLKRYEEAGLNPNLIYSEGKASAGNQSEIARYKAPSLNAPEVDLNSAFGNYYQLVMAQKQVKLLDYDIANKMMENSMMQQSVWRQNRENILNDLLMGNEPPASGFYPSLDIDAIKQSKLFMQYDAKADEQIFQARYMDARAELAKLDKKEQQWVVDNYLEIEKKILNLRQEGLSYVTAIAKVKAENVQALKDMGINTEAIDLIFEAIGSLTNLFDTFAPTKEVFEKLPGGYSKTRKRF